MKQKVLLLRMETKFGFYENNRLFIPDIRTTRIQEC